MTRTHRPGISVPLRLTPSFDAKAWGGRRLESFGKQLPAGKIGESLESRDDAVVDGGPFHGVTLGSLVSSHSESLLGSRGELAAKPFGGFPLLVKLIDAHDDLSVQVHPDDLGAPAGKRGKTEAWYILAAEPGARIISGVHGPISIDSVRDQLVETEVMPGEVYFVPAGTVHAIGKGVLLYEIQQASDVTWRLYDWGRPREIHVDEALIAARPEHHAFRVAPCQVEEGRDILVACRHFALERWRIDGQRPLPAAPETCRVLTVLDGEINLDGVMLPRGATAVLPADLPDLTIQGDAVCLLGYVPELDSDVREPLRAAGYDAGSIRALGADL